MAEYRLEVDPDLILHGSFTQAGGYEMARKMQALQARPTTFCAANNFIAIGAYRALADAGLRVPEDVAMVAFDDLPASMVLEPFFMVAAQPAYEMGRYATELLLRRLTGEDLDACQEIVLPLW